MPVFAPYDEPPDNFTRKMLRDAEKFLRDEFDKTKAENPVDEDKIKELTGRLNSITREKVRRLTPKKEDRGW